MIELLLFVKSNDNKGLVAWSLNDIWCLFTYFEEVEICKIRDLRLI